MTQNTIGFVGELIVSSLSGLEKSGVDNWHVKDGIIPIVMLQQTTTLQFVCEHGFAVLTLMPGNWAVRERTNLDMKWYIVAERLS